MLQDEISALARLEPPNDTNVLGWAETDNPCVQVYVY